ncbi:hypothetical protein N826_12305 [Skermanella aerolata KACC 11604]|nr:hypothetical protein N826_12305 [Skermanella aerolata KACC 11604]
METPAVTARIAGYVRAARTDLAERARRSARSARLRRMTASAPAASPARIMPMA